jgi:hypothetical protein
MVPYQSNFDACANSGRAPTYTSVILLLSGE